MVRYRAVNTKRRTCLGHIRDYVNKILTRSICKGVNGADGVRRIIMKSNSIDILLLTFRCIVFACAGHL